MADKTTLDNAKGSIYRAIATMRDSYKLSDIELLKILLEVQTIVVKDLIKMGNDID